LPIYAFSLEMKPTLIGKMLIFGCAWLNPQSRLSGPLVLCLRNEI
jgi:hypothetical protein